MYICIYSVYYAPVCTHTCVAKQLPHPCHSTANAGTSHGCRSDGRVAISSNAYNITADVYLCVDREPECVIHGNSSLPVATPITTPTATPHRPRLLLLS